MRPLVEPAAASIAVERPSPILAVLRRPVVLRRSVAPVSAASRSGERVLIVGLSPLTHVLLRELERRPRRYTVIGVADDGGGEPPAHCPLLGPLGQLGTIIQDTRPDRIVVALAERRGRLPVRELVEARVCGGVAIEDGTDTYERLTGKLAIESLAPSSLLFSPDFRKSRVALGLERAFSLLAALVGLVLLAPLLGAIALAIKLDSRGPVLFVQDRVGPGGRRFRLLKFRTMRPATGATSEWARDNGDRITRVGRWLRRFRLDELPQFFNILRGDMNVVGPRPHPVSNFELFMAKIPYYSLRVAVRPGLTGWAQVRYGYANNLEEETEKMRYDLYYIKHMSPRLDLRILVETAKTILLGHGAHAPIAVASAPGGRWAARRPTQPRKVA
jgi:exopolysaccharide biosynthesis polyprenyl glycosylphosphotransferase